MNFSISSAETNPSDTALNAANITPSVVDLTVEYDTTATAGEPSKHLVHLHPAGQEYSIDEAGDGQNITERCRQLLLPQGL